MNLITPELFRWFPDAPAMVSAAIEELESLVRSTGFYHNKAKNIWGACASTTAGQCVKPGNTTAVFGYLQYQIGGD